jgi:hypothetical protein
LSPPLKHIQILNKPAGSRQQETNTGGKEAFQLLTNNFQFTLTTNNDLENIGIFNTGQLVLGKETLTLQTNGCESRLSPTNGLSSNVQFQLVNSSGRISPLNARHQKAGNPSGANAD